MRAVSRLRCSVRSGIEHAAGLLRAQGYGLVQLLYPPFCLICGGELDAATKIVCQRCWSSLELIDKPFCQVCGASLRHQEQRCPYCRGTSFSFSAARAAYIYSRDVRRILHAFKFHRKINLAEQVGRAMAFTVLDDERFQAIDGLVPVPLHPSRLRERGYNQSDLLAEAVSAELRIPWLKDALVRKKRTRAMTALTPERRRRNVEHAFETATGAPLEGRRIVLVDDVLTTGATAQACALALIRAGAADVQVLTAARALQFCPDI